MLELMDTPVEHPIKYYHFKCVRCKIDFYEIVDMKNHYFKVHMQVNDGKRTSSMALLDDSEDDEANSSSQQAKKTKRSPTKKTVEQLEQEKQDDMIVNKMCDLNDDQIKLFNWKNIDESSLHDNLAKYANVPKKRHFFKPDVIVWAQWQNMMWPSLVKKTTKESGSSLKIHIRHYETGANRLGAHVFKLDSSRVELFYRCKQHADYKILGSTNSMHRKEFFIAYTHALEDFLKSEKTNDLIIDSENDQAQTSTPLPVKKPHKYSVHGKMLTMEEVEKLAQQDDSPNQIEENLKRQKYSNEILRAVLFDGCQDYLVSIINGSKKCARNEAYLNADARERRRMCFTVGPLVEDDQIQLAKYVRTVSNDFYKNKPKHLINYEFDVLYVEAVIWAIMKADGVAYKKAESKYKHGFKQTHEELVKSKCNEIMLKVKACNDSSISSTLDDKKPDYYEDSSYFAHCAQTDDSRNEDNNQENRKI